MLGDKCAWLLWVSQKFLAIDDMWLAESIKMEIMLYRKEVRHLLQEYFLWNILFLSNFLIYQVPESVNNLMVALNYSLHKNFLKALDTRDHVSQFIRANYLFFFIIPFSITCLCATKFSTLWQSRPRTISHWKQLATEGFPPPYWDVRWSNRYIHHTDR